jgi:C1A family cysteine protease
VAQAIAGAIEYAMSRRANDPDVPDFIEADRVFVPSRLFIYYGAREIIGLTQEDSGCHIRDAMKVVYNLGAPRETGWRYNEDKFAQRPPKRQYRSAPYHKITSYRSVPIEVNAIKAALAEKLPVIFGVAVFESFFANSNGNIPMPGYRERMLGGHAMRAMDWDDSTQTFGGDNSWGTSWGNNGRFRIPYQYLGNPRLGADYWVLTDELYKERM